VAERSKALVCGRLVAGIAGSNPAEGMDMSLLCLYVVFSMCTGGPFLGAKARPRRDADHSPPSSAEVENE
jgi:hypothetical protein